jgi:hypothetical protein
VTKDEVRSVCLNVKYVHFVLKVTKVPFKFCIGCHQYDWLQANLDGYNVWGFQSGEDLYRNVLCYDVV